MLMSTNPQVCGRARLDRLEADRVGNHSHVSLLAWSVDPLVVVGVGLAATLYARGWRRSRLPAWRAVCFGSGLALVVLALESPIGTYDQQLFVLHMTEHML